MKKTVFVGLLIIFIFQQTMVGAVTISNVYHLPSPAPDDSNINIFWKTDILTTGTVTCNFITRSSSTPKTSHSVTFSPFSTGTVSCIITAVDFNNTGNKDTYPYSFPVYYHGPILSVSTSSMSCTTDCREPKSNSYYCPCNYGSFEIRNDGLAPIYNIVVEKSGTLQNWIHLSDTSFNIGGLGRKTINVWVDVPSTTTIIGYGTITISTTTSGAGSPKTIQLYANIVMPGPVCEVTDMGNFGNICTGYPVKKSFTVRELWGYEGISDSNLAISGCAIERSGITQQITPLHLSPFGSSAVYLTLTAPSCGQSPGKYDNCNVNVYCGHSSFSFEIPTPVININPSSLNFTSAIPEKKTEKFRIEEKGGCTPIEVIDDSIKIHKCLYRGNESKICEGWINFDYDTCILPNSFKEVDVKLSVPDGAVCGKYKWEGGIDTTFAGSENINITVNVQAKNIGDMIERIKNISTSNRQNSFKQTMISLLEKIKNNEDCNSNDLSLSIPIRSNAETLLKSFNRIEGYGAEVDYLTIIKEIEKSKEQVNELKEYCEKLSSKYSNDAKKSKDSAENALNYTGNFIANKLYETEARNYETNNYKKSIEGYDKCNNISKLTKSYEKVNECGNGRDRMIKKYENAVSNAKQDIKEAERMQEEVNTMTWFDNSSYKFIARVTDYTNVVSLYNGLISNYYEANQLYNVAGEEEDTNRLAIILNTKQSEKSRVEQWTWIADIILFIILILFMYFIAYLTFLNEGLTFLISGYGGVILLILVAGILTLISVYYLPVLFATMSVIILVWIIISFLRYMNNSKKINLYKVISV